MSRKAHAGVIVLDERPQELTSDGSCDRENPNSQLARRRKANRERMRRGRASPTRCAREQEKRKHRQHLASADVATVSASVSQPIGPVCAICHLRASVEEIVRLELSVTTRGGYVQVRLPYCGRC
jgi:hypothetical protein